MNDAVNNKIIIAWINNGVEINDPLRIVNPNSKYISPSDLIISKHKKTLQVNYLQSFILWGCMDSPIGTKDSLGGCLWQNQEPIASRVFRNFLGIQKIY
jgi:hypothetical protein